MELLIWCIHRKQIEAFYLLDYSILCVTVPQPRFTLVLVFVTLLGHRQMDGVLEHRP